MINSLDNNILVGDMTRPVGEDNIKPDLIEIRCKCVEPFHLIQGRTVSDRRL